MTEKPSLAANWYAALGFFDAEKTSPDQSGMYRVPDASEVWQDQGRTRDVAAYLIDHEPAATAADWLAVHPEDRHPEGGFEPQAEAS